MVEQMADSERESMEFDVVIVGAGPAGLAAAIRLKQINPELSVVVLEKGGEVGAHILSGAVVDPIGIDRLLPGWRDEEGHPFKTAVTDDRFLVLSRAGCVPAAQLHDAAADEQSRQLCRLARQRLPLAGPARPRPGRRDLSGLRRGGSWSIDDNDAVKGVAAGDIGVGQGRRARARTPRRGMELIGKYVFIARGRARLVAKQMIAQIRARRRPGAGEVRARAQGTLGGQARRTTGRARSPTPSAGRWTATPAAAPSCTISRTTSWPSASSSNLNYPQSLPVPLQGVPALQDGIRPSATPSPAASGSPTAPGGDGRGRDGWQWLIAAAVVIGA